MPPSRSRSFAKVDGYRLTFERCDSGAAPTIVFISGLGEPGSVWSPTIESIGRHSWFTYDRSGCGDSDNLTGDLATVPRPVSWAAGQLRQLLAASQVPGPYVLVGHSTGGLIADAYAARWPQDLAGSVLVDTTDPSLHFELARPEPVMIDGAEPGGWPLDFPSTAAEFTQQLPVGPVPTVVIGSAMWRWLRTREPERYLPFSPIEVDQRWHLHQLRLAQRWDAQLVIPHEAGHHVHKDAPQLVGVVVAAVAAAAARHRPVEIDRAALALAGGALSLAADHGRLTAVSPQRPHTNRGGC